jgi:hypothetical protein
MANVWLCLTINYELAAEIHRADIHPRKSICVISLPAIDRYIDPHGG